jgi:SAM-dependent methyltransferase
MPVERSHLAGTTGGTAGGVDGGTAGGANGATARGTPAEPAGTVVDLSHPSVARMFDYWLGGCHNFAVDRRAAEGIASFLPGSQRFARGNRSFVRRAVRFLARAGITQFLDLGSGIPTVGSVHEIAQKADPRARVAYADIDPVVIAHSASLLTGTVGVRMVRGDLRNPGELLAEPALRATLDLRQPVAVLMASVLHSVPDRDGPCHILGEWRDALAPGSYLVISHLSDEETGTRISEARELYRLPPTNVTLRSGAELADLFHGFDLVEPGIVPLPLWRPDSPEDAVDAAGAFPALGAVGRKA